MTDITTVPVSDLECAVRQILDDDAGRITHPVLRAYVDARAADPAFAARVYQWEPGEDTIARAEAWGFPRPTRTGPFPTEGWHGQFGHGYGPNHYGPIEDYDADEANRRRGRDQTIAALVDALVGYRQRGRPRRRPDACPARGRRSRRVGDDLVSRRTRGVSRSHRRGAAR